MKLLKKYLLLLLLLSICSEAFAQNKSIFSQFYILKTVEPNSGFTDLEESFGEIADSVSIIGLGESTHGSHEIFKIKHRLLEYLIIKKGFKNLAIEHDFTFSEIMNDYIQGMNVDSISIKMSLSRFPLLDTKEIWDMLKWMKEYNKSALIKIKIYGFDIQSSDAIRKLRKVKTLNTSLLRLIHSADSLIASRVGYYPFMKAGKKQIKFKETVITFDSICNSIHKLIKTSEDSIKSDYEIYSLLLTRYSKFILDKNPNLRDSLMAENIKWIYSNGNNFKTILWGHNFHIAKGSSFQEDVKKLLPLGIYIKSWFKYYSIAFATSNGFYTAYENMNGIKPVCDNKLHPPTKQSYENLLKSMNYPLFFMPLTAEDSYSLPSEMAFRYVGTIKFNGKDQFYPKIRIKNDYDGLIYIDNTSAAQNSACR
jgi:erythromycin esterase